MQSAVSDLVLSAICIHTFYAVSKHNVYRPSGEYALYASRPATCVTLLAVTAVAGLPVAEIILTAIGLPVAENLWTPAHWAVIIFGTSDKNL